MTELNSDQSPKKADLPQVQVNLESNLKTLLGDKLTFLPSLAWKEYGLCVLVNAADLKLVMSTLKENQQTNFDMLIDVTCVDWLDQKESRFEVVYQLLSTTFFHRLCVKVLTSEAKPEVDTVRDLWPTANFLEREVFDMFGVIFKGHGDLRRILMYDEFVGHPLRKDYPLQGKQPRIELRVPELRNTSNDLSRGQLVAMPTKKQVA